MRVRFQIAAICHWVQKIRKFSSSQIEITNTEMYPCQNTHTCVCIWCKPLGQDLWGIFLLLHKIVYSSIGNGFARCNAFCLQLCKGEDSSCRLLTMREEKKSLDLPRGDSYYISTFFAFIFYDPTLLCIIHLNTVSYIFIHCGTECGWDAKKIT